MKVITAAIALACLWVGTVSLAQEHGERREPGEMPGAEGKGGDRDVPKAVRPVPPTRSPILDPIPLADAVEPLTLTGWIVLPDSPLGYAPGAPTEGPLDKSQLSGAQPQWISSSGLAPAPKARICGFVADVRGRYVYVGDHTRVYFCTWRDAGERKTDNQ